MVLAAPQPAWAIPGSSVLSSAAPLKLLASGGLAGGAAGATREMGGGPIAQTAAGFAGGMVPYAADLAAPLITHSSMTPARNSAHKILVIHFPPGTMSEPSPLSKFLGAWGGKVKSQQAVSTANQAMTNQIAASDLGLPLDADLSMEGGGLRSRARASFCCL